MSNEQAANPRDVARAIVPLVIDIALPVVVYYVLHGAGMGNVAALCLGGVIPAAHVVVCAVRDRRADPLAVLVTALFVVTVVTTLLSGNARFLLVKESFVTGAAGLWCLATASRSRSVTYSTARPMMTLGRPAHLAAWERLNADRHGVFHQATRRVATLWGVGLVVEAAARVWVALHFSVHSAAGLVNVPIIAITVLLCILSPRFGGETIKTMLDEEARRAPEDGRRSAVSAGSGSRPLG